MPPFLSSVGNSSQRTGCSKRATLSLTQSGKQLISVPGSHSTTATGRCPNSASSSGTINTWLICGWRAITRSRLSGWIPSPPLKKRGCPCGPGSSGDRHAIHRDRGWRTIPARWSAELVRRPASSLRPYSLPGSRLHRQPPAPLCPAAHSLRPARRPPLSRRR